MLDERQRRLIDQELGEIDALLDRSQNLLSVSDDETPPFERLAALSHILNSFYTGLERVFERITGQVDKSIPEGDRWHAELLGQVAKSTSNRIAVISKESRTRLREYMAFRHRSRHAYAHHLEWVPMQHLVEQLMDTWRRVHSDIQGFLAEGVNDSID
jgi:hypothetical protein